MSMKFLLILAMFCISVHLRYLNLGNFLKPILNPVEESFGDDNDNQRA